MSEEQIEQPEQPDSGVLTAEEQREKLMKSERKGRRAVSRMAKKLETLQVVYVDVDAIKPNSYNPNRQSEHDFELLLRSMEEDGFTQPCLAVTVSEEMREDAIFKGYDVGDIVIVDGEHRWRAAQVLGYEKIPIVLTDMTPIQMRISTLRHNRAKGSEDVELTGDLVRDLIALGARDWGQDSLMMSDVEIERLAEDMPASEALAGEEYDEAWEPDKAGSDVAPVEGRSSTHDSGEWTNASTQQALDAARQREQAIKEAKTEEQRDMIRKDMAKDFYRVSLLLYGDDAVAAKKILKGAPAEAFAKLCRDAVGMEPELADETWVLIEDVIGRRTIPAEVAAVIKRAITEAEIRGDLGEKNAFQFFEYLAADYLASTPA